MKDIKITATFGALIRSACIHGLKDFCWRHNYPISIDEDKGWIESHYRITITVPDNEETDVRYSLDKWIEKLNS